MRGICFSLHHDFIERMGAITMLASRSHHRMSEGRKTSDVIREPRSQTNSTKTSEVNLLNLQCVENTQDHPDPGDGQEDTIDNAEDFGASKVLVLDGAEDPGDAVADGH